MNFVPIDKHHLLRTYRALPGSVRKLLKENSLCVAGGFVRDNVAWDARPSDIDIFAPSKEVAELGARRLAGDTKLISTDNAFTVTNGRYPVQFIHRWTFEKPEHVAPSFDFTIAMGCIWWSKERKEWQGCVHENFYAHLAAKLLVYTSPVREEAACGSMMRVLKFIARGYRIDLQSLAAVMARMEAKIEDSKIEKEIGDAWHREAWVARIFLSLLREVDPLIDPDHVFHGENLETQE